MTVTPTSRSVIFLQRMEAYRGLAILTTNMKEALDQAFLRRIRFVIQFPFPDVAQRTEIWKSVFPPQTPTESLDMNRLAKLSITGGNIRNIALYSAFFGGQIWQISAHGSFTTRCSSGIRQT